MSRFRCAYPFLFFGLVRRKLRIHFALCWLWIYPLGHFICAYFMWMRMSPNQMPQKFVYDNALCPRKILTRTIAHIIFKLWPPPTHNVFHFTVTILLPLRFNTLNVWINGCKVYWFALVLLSHQPIHCLSSNITYVKFSSKYEDMNERIKISLLQRYQSVSNFYSAKIKGRRSHF